MSRRRGLALAELMVSAGVLLLMLGLVTMALLGYLRGTQTLFAQPMPAEGVARGLERCCRLLRSTSAVVRPDRAALEAGYRPTLEQPLVVRVRLPEREEAMGLSFDPARQCLIQLLYGESYDPQRPGRRLELGPAAGLTLRLEGEQLHLRVDAGAQQLPWSTAVVFP